MADKLTMGAIESRAAVEEDGDEAMMRVECRAAIRQCCLFD
jgi:hypothetical protein